MYVKLSTEELLEANANKGNGKGGRVTPWGEGGACVLLLSSFQARSVRLEHAPQKRPSPGLPV